MTEDTTTLEPEDDDEAEVAAIAAVAKALKGLAPGTRRRVIGWAAGRYGAASTDPAPESTDSTGGGRRSRRRTTPAGARGSTVPKAPAKRKAGALSLDKALDLRPKGVQSFADFATAKAPNTINERNVVSVYWLTRIAGHDGATVDQVYTCYKDRAWRLPANPRNKLAVTASTKAWIDTSDMESITVTVGGENFVEHDLPASGKDDA